jgi:aromatic ring-cleaving dioxygenase
MRLTVARIAAVLCVTAVALCARVSLAATPGEVQNAIDKAVRYLYEQQKGGNWEGSRKARKIVSPAQDQPGGMTVTATYALLSVGERRDVLPLSMAIRYLQTYDFTSVYTLGMRCQVWRMLLPDDHVKAALRRDGRLLVKGVSSDTGMYDSRVDGQNNPPDHGVSQYGVLGVWAYAQEGMEVPTSYWQSVDSGWRQAQHTDGSWNYGKKPVDKAQTLPMTAAGLATLFIAQDALSMGVSPSSKGNVSDTQIDSGLAWLGAHFMEVFKSKYQYYTLYELEELGAASGRKYFGNTDWYAQGADYLVRSQKSDGSWNSTVADTALSLLFLTHGRAPVGMNKLQYFSATGAGGAGGGRAERDWNQRPRDLANFDRWMGKQVELDRLLNWQVVDLNAPAADLHEASILYVTGDKALGLAEADKQKIKTFIEQGGMVLFNADYGSAAFSASVKQLAAELFPGIGEFRELPTDHCILTKEQFLGSAWKDPPTILGLSNGVRELMILLPKADVSQAWQGQLTSSKETLFELGADLLLYASDKQNIREKGDSYIAEPSGRIQATRSLKVARIQYDGMWDPEPGGWRRLAAVMHNRDQLDLAVHPVTLGPKSDLTDYKVAHLTGSGHVKLSTSDWIQLHSFVENGGTLIVDAAGGSQTFNDDVRAQLQSTFFDQANQIDQPLRSGHVLYSEIGSRIDEVGYRNFARHVLMENLKMPRIRGMKIDRRIGVFYSAEDISAGLVGEPVDGIVGYDPESATSLMEHMILYAESGGRPTTGMSDNSAGG